MTLPVAPPGPMTPERYRQVKGVLQEALERTPAERPEYLARACAGDPELRREVESLLAAQGTGDTARLDGAVAWEVAARLAGSGGGAEPEPLLSAGQELAGRYRIERFLARGGMGEVYAAVDLELETAVALKTLRPALASNPVALRRFKQEVMLARGVAHPHVCRVFDLGLHGEGVHGEGARRLPFLTMELLEGETLAERLAASRGGLPAREVLPLVRQMAEALEAGHRAGIVHRDFKSANVMLTRGEEGERAVVLDFGLAQRGGAEAGARARAEDGRSEAEVLVGTPAYMAPEQVRGERVGPAADLYALGVVLFQMLTGRLPFCGRDARSTAMARLTAEPPSPRQFAEVEGRWEATVLRLLQRDPVARFARATDAVRALEGEAVAAVTRHTLPAERDGFVGREEDLASLAALLAEARLVSLLGPAGCGKTRLATRFGRRSLASWPGGVWFCDLSEARDRDGIVQAVARSLDVPLGKEDPVVQLGHAIAGRGRCLIVLDNFEQVVAEADATAGRWVARAEEARFLVTSRERLNLKEEAVLALEPLPSGAGVELFELRARAQRPDFRVAAENRAAVEEVVRLLDGLPLAIELAAARLRVMGLEQMASWLVDRFRLLGGPRARGRHATLEVAIDASWELLSPWERAAFAQASVFEGGFTLEAAEEVLDLTPWNEAPWVVDVLQALVDKSLLRVSSFEGAKEPRFGSYVSLQEYGRAKLVEGGGAGAAEERHGKHFARLGTEDALKSLDSHGGVERRRSLAFELDNLVAACRRAVSRGDGDTASQAYAAAWEVLELKGPFATGAELGGRVLQLEALAPGARARVLVAVGHASWRAGRMEESREHYERALAIQRQVGDRRGEGIVFGGLGNLHHRQGRTEEAREHYERALAIHREIGNRCFEARILGSLGLLQYQQGRIEEAREHYERALAIQREVGNRRFEGVVLGSLGGLHFNQGQMQAAREHFDQALAIHREVGNRHYEGNEIGNLANLHYQQGRIEEGREHYERALAVSREVGDRNSEGICHGNLGVLNCEQGRFAQGCEHFDRALAIHREVGDRHSEGFALGNLGAMYYDQGRMEEAREHYDRALAIHCEVGNRCSEGVVLAYLGALHVREGRPGDAHAAFARGESLLREVGDRLELGKLLCRRGEAERQASDLARALASLAEAEALAAACGAGQESELGRAAAALRRALETAESSLHPPAPTS